MQMPSARLAAVRRPERLGASGEKSGEGRLTADQARPGHAREKKRDAAAITAAA